MQDSKIRKKLRMLLYTVARDGCIIAAMHVWFIVKQSFIAAPVTKKLDERPTGPAVLLQSLLSPGVGRARIRLMVLFLVELRIRQCILCWLLIRHCLPDFLGTYSDSYSDSMFGFEKI